jgi:hypothetical protein
MFSERELYPFHPRLALSSPLRTLRCAKIIKNTLKTTAFRSEGYCGRLSTHIGIRPGHLQRRPHCHPPSRSRYFISTLNPKQHVPEPHCNHLNLKLSIHLRQCHQKLTRRRPRKISAPIHYSTNSRTVILQMPSSPYFINKFPGSTNLAVLMTN